MIVHPLPLKKRKNSLQISTGQPNLLCGRKGYYPQFFSIALHSIVNTQLRLLGDLFHLCKYRRFMDKALSFNIPIDFLSSEGSGHLEKLGL